jgi:hypothetical protein
MAAAMKGPDFLSRTPAEKPFRAAINVVSQLNPLIDAFVTGWAGDRLTANYSFSAGDWEAFYRRLCRDGADIVFLGFGASRTWEKIKSNPELSGIPIVIVELWAFGKEMEKAIESYLAAGAAAAWIGVPPFAVVEEDLNRIFRDH